MSVAAPTPHNTAEIQGNTNLMIPTKLSHLMAGLIPDADDGRAAP